jgi:C4-dicarboxylate-specific signal transduction histidine kinase
MDPLTTLYDLKYTRSKPELLAKVRSFEGRYGETFPVKSVIEEAQLSQRNWMELRSGVTLSALKALATQMGGLRDGRKSILFFSQGPGVRPGSPNDQLLREIAERARIEKELEDARSDLECRVTERTTELSAVNEALRREIAERQRAEEQMQQHREELAHTLRVQTVGQMMGSLAHELNQPLTAIANNIEACSTYIDAGEIDDRTLRGLLDHATSEALRAGSIVHHLRAFLEKREPQVEPGDLCDLARDVADLLQAEAREHNVALVVDIKTEPLPIMGNRIQLEQVIVNLVRNAIDSMEATRDGVREVRVEVRATPRDTAEIAVVDSGEGVDEEHMRRVFEPFFTTKRQGLGLGLAISRSIVEAHHGRLWLENRVDGPRGAVAVFEVPIRKGDQ